MAITISGENNNDKILASDGVIDSLSGFNVVGVITATSFTGDLTGDVTGNLTGNVTGNINNTTLLLQTGGTERLRIDSSGNLLGGTTSASSLSNFGSNTGGMILDNVSSSNTALLVTHDTSELFVAVDSSSGYIWQDSNHPIKFGTNGTERLRIKSDGKVLIGDTLGLGGATSSPSGLLHCQAPSGEGLIKIIGATSGVVQISGYNGDSTIQFGDASSDAPGKLNYDHGTDSLAIVTNGSERLRILSDGRMILGATSTIGNSYSNNFTVSEASGNVGMQFAGNNSTSNYASIYFGDAGHRQKHFIETQLGTNGHFTIGTIGTGPIRFTNSGGERLRITSAGFVGVGTATVGRGPLELSRSDTGDVQIHMTNAKTGGGTGNGFTIFGCNASAGDAGFVNRHNGGAIEFYTNTGGTLAERLRIDSSGRVGINEQSPQSLLDIHDSASANDTPEIRIESFRPIIRFADRSGSHADSEICGDDGIKFRVSAESDNDTALTERLRITAGGTVNIGGDFTNTTGKLKVTGQTNLYGNGNAAVVWGNTGYSGHLSYDGSDNAVIRAASGKALIFQTNHVNERLRITSDGKIGVNYAGTPPSETMMISSTDSTTGLSVSHLSGGNRYGARLSTISGTNQGIIISGFFNSGYTEHVRVNTHGFVKMKGDMSSHMSADGNNYHEMQADNPHIQILNMRHGSSNGYGIMTQFNHGKSTHWAFRVYDYSTGTSHLFMRTDGDMENTNNSYGGISDVKLKENIVDAPSQWNDLKALKVRNFNFKNDSSKKKLLGLVAQEAEQVCPSLVKEQPDRGGQDNEDLGTTTKVLKYSVLYMKAIKALQEAQERIEKLEQDNIALRVRVTNLEGN